MRLLDLFSGIGGFSLGLERAGFETVAFCEVDPYCRAVLAKHWPEVPCYEDVCALDAARLQADGIAVDAICGGFPCQDVSLAGRRAGLDAARSGLWREFARLIGELRPRFAIVENVPGLLSDGMGRVLGDLAALGYDAEWHCIPASAVGADHLRDRVWIVAYPDCTGSKPLHKQRGESRSGEVGEDATHDHSARLPRRQQTKSLNQDARAISPRLGLALSSPPAFPREYGTCKPVLGRGENGLSHRVDRMHAIGNAVVPQIPEIIGRNIMALMA